MKRGFTLIELLGVMVILALLIAFSIPSIINFMKQGSDTKDQATLELIYHAAENYMSDNKNMFSKNKNNTYCVALKTLETEGYIEGPMTLNSSKENIVEDYNVEIKYDGKEYKYEIKDVCNGIIDPTPILYDGLTPVIYKNGSWQAPLDNEKWYNYDEQMWANAKIRIDGIVEPVIFVWIPKYEYKIESNNKIDIKFILKNQKEADTGYTIPSIFVFNNKQLSGIWVSKYEQGSSGTVNLENLNVQNMDVNYWNAVSYLSNSKYGKAQCLNECEVSNSTTGNIYGIYGLSDSYESSPSTRLILIKK